MKSIEITLNIILNDNKESINLQNIVEELRMLFKDNTEIFPYKAMQAEISACADGEIAEYCGIEYTIGKEQYSGVPSAMR